MARSGRRTGAGATKQAILQAAREDFHAQGYAGATMRSIAAGAGVDPALIHHYFESKRSLFVAAMQLPIDPQRVVQAVTGEDRDRLGETLVRLFFSIWESPDADPFIAVLRSAMTHEDAAVMLREMVSQEVIGPVAEALEVDNPELRTSLVGSHMAGLAMMRYIIRLEPLASADPHLLVEAVGPAVQRYLTEPLWQGAN